MGITVSKNGFSLMEVMVALALLALSFTSLILVQSRATNLAVQSRFISIATQLARFQLMECKREAQKIIASASDFKKEGDYVDKGFEQFKWECHAPRFNMRTPPAGKIESQAKENASGKLKDQMNTTSSAMAPMMSLITDSLGNSVRELVVIVRWSNNNIEDEVRVVTHIVDLTAMSALANMLKQTTSSSSKPSTPKPQEGSFPPGPPGAPPPNAPFSPPPRFRGGPPSAP